MFVKSRLREGTCVSTVFVHDGGTLDVRWVIQPVQMLAHPAAIAATLALNGHTQSSPTDGGTRCDFVLRIA